MKSSWYAIGANTCSGTSRSCFRSTGNDPDKLIALQSIYLGAKKGKNLGIVCKKSY